MMVIFFFQCQCKCKSACTVREFFKWPRFNVPCMCFGLYINCQVVPGNLSDVCSLYSISFVVIAKTG